MIGIIGVGGVARYAHLPSYAALGLPVAALCDRDPDVLREVAAAFGVARTTTSPEELIADPAVSVVDIATPPASHAELLALAARYRKPVLVQKPLCTGPAELRAILALRQQGLRARLNLTGRHVSAWRKVAELIEGGRLGRPALCTIVNRDWWDRAPGRWDHAIPNYIVFEIVIHHLDLCLYWFGRPAKVTARGGRHPGQALAQKNWATVTLEYPDGLAVQIVDDWTMSEYAFATGHPFEEVLVTGEHGVVRASSERVELSRRGENTVELWHLPRPGQTLPGESLEVEWFPGSFGHAMRDFLTSVDAPEGAAADWRHLRDLTALTFTVADALTSDRWLAFEPDSFPTR